MKNVSNPEWDAVHFADGELVLHLLDNDGRFTGVGASEMCSEAEAPGMIPVLYLRAVNKYRHQPATGELWQSPLDG